MALQEGEFSGHIVSTKSGRPRGAKNKKRPLTDTEKKRNYRRNKTARAQREAARAAREQADRLAAEIAGGSYAVHHVSIDDVTAEMLPDEVAAAVITDPPYPEKYLPLFSSLGRLSARVLKPGGWCVVMPGSTFLPEVIRRLDDHLTFRWMYAITTPGGLNNRNPAVGLFQAWKPVLIYQKPPIGKIREWWSDLIAAKADEHDKSAHKWQQSETVFAELVKRFSLAGDLVVDLFAGSGTTGRAAISQGRHFWGCDIDKECMK